MTKGIKFGKYTLHKRIAVGGMAEIYLASQKLQPQNITRLVALKRILPEYLNDPTFIKMFLNEAKIASYLNHPNITFIYEVGEVKGIYYIAMEFIPGVNLKSLIRSAFPIPIEIVLYTISHIANALSYAHKFKKDGKPLNIVHRDVTPHNIMLSFSGEVKLLDFGIAKARIQAEKTRSGILKGKYAYMSPEQALKGDIDHRTDIFSLGVVLYEAVTGLRPFSGKTPIEILHSIQECNPIRPSLISTRVTPKLEEIIMKCLRKDPNERYQDAEQLAYELEQLLFEIDPKFKTSYISEFLKKNFPEKLKFIETVKKEIEKVPLDIEKTEVITEESLQKVERAPFEEFADDLEEAPTKIWGGNSISSIIEKRKKEKSEIKKLIFITVSIGLLLGIALGVGIWLLYTFLLFQ